MNHEGFINCCRLSLVALFFCLLSVVSSNLYSCPAFMHRADLGQIKTKIHAKDLSLYSYQESTKKWHLETLDIEKADRLSQIDMNSINNFEKDSIFEKNTRLVFEFPQSVTDRFNPDPSSPKDLKNLPCSNPSFIYEIYSPRYHSYLYLTDCKENSSSSKPIVLNDISQDLIYSSFFKFFHYPKNHVAFKNIEVISKDKTKFISAADNATLAVYLDIKYFLSIELGASNLFSQIRSWFTTPQQKIADVSFFWKLLFMDIDINMRATTSFYKESVFIPFQMNVPAESRDYLNKNSGSLYSWNVNDIISYDMSGETLPIFNLSDVKKAASSKLTQKFCHGKLCKFSLNGKGPDFNFTAYFAMEKKMVDLGFFPFLVTDEAKARHDLGWDSKINPALKNRIGIYMNVSGLRTGDYYWDFWIDVDKDRTNLPAVCPTPIKVSPIFISG